LLGLWYVLENFLTFSFNVLIFVFILWDCFGSQISDSCQGYQTIKKKGPFE